MGKLSADFGLAKQLRTQRKAAGLTQSELAAKSGVAERTVRALEQGAGTKESWTRWARARISHRPARRRRFSRTRETHRLTNAGRRPRSCSTCFAESSGGSTLTRAPRGNQGRKSKPASTSPRTTTASPFRGKGWSSLIRHTGEVSPCGSRRRVLRLRKDEPRRLWPFFRLARTRPTGMSTWRAALSSTFFEAGFDSATAGRALRSHRPWRYGERAKTRFARLMSHCLGRGGFTENAHSLLSNVLEAAPPEPLHDGRRLSGRDWARATTAPISFACGPPALPTRKSAQSVDNYPNHPQYRLLLRVDKPDARSSSSDWATRTRTAVNDRNE